MGTARHLSDPLLLFEPEQGRGLLPPINNRILPAALDEERKEDTLCPNGHWPVPASYQTAGVLGVLEDGVQLVSKCEVSGDVVVPRPHHFSASYDMVQKNQCKGADTGA